MAEVSSCRAFTLVSLTCPLGCISRPKASKGAPGGPKLDAAVGAQWEGTRSFQKASLKAQVFGTEEVLTGHLHFKVVLMTFHTRDI